MVGILLPGTCGCSPGHGLAGYEVRRWTQSPYGHSFMVMPDGKVIEATGKGVILAPLDKYLDKPGVVWNDEEPLTTDFRQAAARVGYAKLGAPYDHYVNVDIAFSLIFGVKSPYLPAGRHGAFNCSQLITVIYTEAGRVMFPQVDRWRISPRLLADRITDRAWRREPPSDAASPAAR